MPDSIIKKYIEYCFNNLINATVPVFGVFEKDILKNIISIQYQAPNKTIFIETETFNYVLTESDGLLRLCEFYKKEDMENKVKR